MKQILRQKIEQAARSFSEFKNGEDLPKFDLERPKVKAHGELSANLPMLLAKRLGRKPHEIANELIQRLQDQNPDFFESVSVAGGGFINFVLKPKLWQEALRDVRLQGEAFGLAKWGEGKKVVIEFVSANPTGPLHIGNARGGPLGDVIASLLKTQGFDVTREYYLNDVGGQIDKLGESILYWIKNKDVPDAPGPEGYQGEYVKEVAKAALETLSEKLDWENTSESVKTLGRFGIKYLTEEIKRDCDGMGIHFDSWIQEKWVLGSGLTEQVIQELEKRGVTKKHEGAVWFTPEAVDDPLSDRESVLVRTDGRPTYFANDIAYHLEKYKKGYDRLINIWGSNHHGHVPRVQGAMKSLGYDPSKIETVLYQYVRVKRGAEAVKMSKRGGNFVTAREVLDEVGSDALRFFLLMRAPESHLDFDLELAKKNTQENPVYYVQYAHARAASILRKAEEQKIALPSRDSVHLDRLVLTEELDLVRLIMEYPDELKRAAEDLTPHRIAFYLQELAKQFQSYYARAKEDPRYRVLSSDIDTVQAKLYLCLSLKQVIAQGLKLLGVSAPESMSHEELISQ